MSGVAGRTDGSVHAGSEAKWTLSWREMDSNPRSPAIDDDLA
jgi:hypothetical protein